MLEGKYHLSYSFNQKRHGGYIPVLSFPVFGVVVADFDNTTWSGLRSTCKSKAWGFMCTDSGIHIYLPPNVRYPRGADQYYYSRCIACGLWREKLHGHMPVIMTENKYGQEWMRRHMGAMRCAYSISGTEPKTKTERECCGCDRRKGILYRHCPSKCACHRIP